MTREQLKDAVVEAAQQWRAAERRGDRPGCLDALNSIERALIVLDAHPAQEVVTLAVWNVSAGQSVRFVVAGAEDDRPDAVWEVRLGTVTLPLTPGGRAMRWEPTHRHRKGGLYRVLMRGPLVRIEATAEPAVIYDDAEGNVWVRPAVEFDDGRFALWEGGQ